MTEAQKTGMTLEGVVVKAAMKDTVTVLVSRYVKHPKYKKYQRKTKKYLVHNPGGAVQVGDEVEIRQTKPISKRKHFIVSAKLSHANQAPSDN
jgi:small subunit ribosomal protein S17